MVKTLDGLWSSPRVRRLLVNPKYAGIRTRKMVDPKTKQTKVVEYPGDWTPLIDVDTHRGLVAYLSNPDRITNHNSFERKYLGSGLYLCGRCDDGTAMKAAQPGGKSPRPAPLRLSCARPSGAGGPAGRCLRDSHCAGTDHAA